MAFFEELGKKVSEAGQKTLQKTKEFSDVARLNSMISDEEKRINEYYFQIGKLYVSLHGADYEADFAGMIQGIQDANVKIEELKKQVLEVKGVQICEVCGAEVTKESAFCNSCGAAMPKPKTEEIIDMTKCGSCGAMTKAGMRFCTSCGSPLDDGNMISSADAVVEDVVVETVGAENTISLAKAEETES